MFLLENLEGNIKIDEIDRDNERNRETNKTQKISKALLISLAGHKDRDMRTLAKFTTEGN